MLVHKVKKTELPFKLKKDENTPDLTDKNWMELTSRMKMAKFQTFWIHMRKINLWMKVTKLAKPQGQKWHFNL
ncbi:hypothetical protein Hanom_Chr01g00010771 [Helianthus anomalus]